MIPMFGWSVGDLALSIKIIIKICQAFKASGGASGRYTETVAFLEGLKSCLTRLNEFADNASNNHSQYAQDFQEQLRLLDGPYAEFEKYMLGFCPALDPSSKQNLVKKSSMKIRWAVSELSDVAGKVAILKKSIADPCHGPLGDSTSTIWQTYVWVSWRGVSRIK